MILPLDSTLEPVITRSLLKKIEADPQWAEDEVAHCQDEPWYWLVNYCYSIRKDERNPDARPEVLRFPPKPHLQVVFHRCFAEPFLSLDKSRQLTISWLLMAYYTWRMQFGSNEQIVIQTKREDDVQDELLWRMDFLMKSQRWWLRPKYSDKSWTHCKFGYGNNRLKGLPGGDKAGDKIRSANPSRYYLDEAGFVGPFDECLSQAMACCNDIKLVSTANYGEWARFINDIRE